MEARARNSNLDFETLFSDFQELLNGSGLNPKRKVAETFELDGKEPLFSQRAMGISKRVLG